MLYVLGDDELRLEGSEGFSDLLYLTRTDVGEGRENDLFVGSE